MAPNHGAEVPMSLMQAPGGADSFLPLSFPLFWALKHDPWQMRVGGRGSLLCGRCSFARSNNQVNSVVGGREDFEEEMRRRWNVWGGRRHIVLAVK